jgi:hypothetical protein
MTDLPQTTVAVNLKLDEGGSGEMLNRLQEFLGPYNDKGQFRAHGLGKVLELLTRRLRPW